MAIKIVAVAALLLVQASAIAGPKRLRAASPPPAIGSRGKCVGRQGIQFLEADTEFGNQTVFYDGFSRMGCDIDVSPEKVRISFKEHACGGEVKSCRLTELPMEPRLCFDFCRTQQSAKFFGLVHGRDCYCTTYFHPKSTGGQGVCDAQCEGNEKEMCGGMEKSSLFEMHMCGDSADEASVVLEEVTDAEDAAAASTREADDTVQQLRDLAKAWQVDVCSLAPEGQRVCALNQVWLDMAAGPGKVSAEAKHALSVMKESAVELESLKDQAVEAGSEVTVDLAQNLEKSTKALGTKAGKTKGATGLLDTAMATLKGPLDFEKIQSFGDTVDAAKKVFIPLGDVKADWHGVCALERIEGESYAAIMKGSDWGACARRCISLSTGTEACVAFNFQKRGALTTCQLLKEKGLIQPKDRIAKAVPIFEVSDDKMKSLGMSALGCYAKSGFIAAHPKGSLATHVVKEVTV